MAGLTDIIGFDMGGTSTDVALYAGGFERAFETQVAGVRMRAPMMAINTVAAGGGSILHFDGARPRVGPGQRGSADPGPACYRRGGTAPTVTDANVCVGKIQPAHFPAIFGPDGDQRLDADVVMAKFGELAEAVSRATGHPRSPQETAEGFLRIAVANMANAIKQVSVQKGHDVSRFALQWRWWRGRPARSLWWRTRWGWRRCSCIRSPACALSAHGMGLADQAVMREQAVEVPLTPDAMPDLEALANRLAVDAGAALANQGADPARINVESTLHLRYAGTEAALIAVLDHAGPDRCRFHPGASRALRFCDALIARWWWRRWLSRRLFRATRCRRATLAARETGAPGVIDRVAIFSGGEAA